MFSVHLPISDCIFAGPVRNGDPHAVNTACTFYPEKSWLLRSQGHHCVGHFGVSVVTVSAGACENDSEVRWFWCCCEACSAHRLTITSAERLAVQRRGRRRTGFSMLHQCPGGVPVRCNGLLASGASRNDFECKYKPGIRHSRPLKFSGSSVSRASDCVSPEVNSA